MKLSTDSVTGRSLLRSDGFGMQWLPPWSNDNDERAFFSHKLSLVGVGCRTHLYSYRPGCFVVVVFTQQNIPAAIVVDTET